MREVYLKLIIETNKEENRVRTIRRTLKPVRFSTNSSSCMRGEPGNLRFLEMYAAKNLLKDSGKIGHDSI